MTQTSHLKSAPLTNLDAAPPVTNTTGNGAPARLKSTSGFVTTVSGDLGGTTYQLVRVPSNARIKQILSSSQAMGAGDIDLSVYYSSANDDGTAPANQGLVVPTTGAVFFRDGLDVTNAVAQTDYTFANAANAGSYNQGLVNKRLWDALGLASDPGGYFDIVAVVAATTITTGALISLTVNWTD